jgi:predicted Zn-dependent peptidase
MSRCVCTSIVASMLAIWTPGLDGQTVGRDAALSLEFEALKFDPPDPEIHEVLGVPVLFIEDHSVPLVSVFASFKGGYARLPRGEYAAGTALASLLRFGGTQTLAPDSVDKLLEYYSIQTLFGGGGESVVASLNTLTEHLPLALDLWAQLLKQPAFDDDQIDIWRGRAVEQIRRREDNVQGLAYSEFNRLMYGDHPVGWEMRMDDLSEEALNREQLLKVHSKILCRQQMTLGASGDVSWPDLEVQLRRALADWPHCEGELPPSPAPDIRREPGVFVIPRALEQSVIVMAHPTSVHMAEDPEYFAAQIGNSILGSGGFSSRLLARVRTEEGYAYSASSLWTMPRRYDGLVGAITQTRPESTVPAIRLMLETMTEMTEEPPSADEVRTGVDRLVNGFVFNFDTPGRIVSRRMYYLARELSPDWLERYLRGVQGVTPSAIHDVFRRNLRPEAMTILVVGDPERIGRESLASLGPVTIWEVEGGR